MSGARWPPYPSCTTGTCKDIICCAQDHKFGWPELVGQTAREAMAVIQRDNPTVTVVMLKPGQVGSPDLCCNRVYVALNAQGNVINVPIVG